MVPVKGLDVLLRAVRRLKDRGAAFHLYLVGDGPLRAELEAQAAALGVSGDVSFVGGVDHDRLPDWYRAADLTVLPSRSEGVPNVLRESLACGTPFVASRVGGVHELAGGDRDGLVEPEDPAALAAALERALSDAGPARIPTSPSADLADAVAPLTRLFRDLTAGTAGRPPVEEPDLRETVRPA
jgi:glycosyltransferase involved in cell wall biosynthesis